VLFNDDVGVMFSYARAVVCVKQSLNDTQRVAFNK